LPATAVNGLKSRGRIGPSGARVADEFDEREVVFLLSHRVGVDTKREGRIGVPELLGDPPNALAGGECQRPRCGACDGA
jgi:hypothetical protein